MLQRETANRIDRRPRKRTITRMSKADQEALALADALRTWEDLCIQRYGFLIRGRESVL